MVYYKESLLSGLLKECTDGQKDMFKRMYKSIEEMKEDDMRFAYMQIQTALKMKKEADDEANGDR